MKKIIVIVPAYNEEKTIQEVINRMPKFDDAGIELKVVVVDDGSSDLTGKLAREAGATVLTHAKNQGLGKTFRDGLTYCFENNADVMVNIDADLQYDPQDIRKLIQPILDDKADFVTADRFKSEDGKLVRPANMPKIKFWGNQQMTKLVNSLAGSNVGDASSGFRAISCEAILNLNLSGKYTYTHETILDLGYKGLRLESIPINVKYFPDRKSRVASNLFAYGARTLNIIVRAFRDYKPLHFFGLLAAFPLISGFCLLLFSLIYYIIHQSFSPYKFVSFIGIYLFSLGLLLLIIGFLSDILVSIRLTGEKQLYLQKKQMQNKDR